MEQPDGELTVVREEQRAAGVKVQPADRNDARPDFLQVFGNGGTTLRVVHRAHHVSRLVKYEIHERLGLDASAVHLYPAGLRVCSGAKFGDHLPVDGHAARDDERLGLATGCDPGLGENLLEALGCHEAAHSTPACPRSIPAPTGAGSSERLGAAGILTWLGARHVSS